jgi:hypothetical protein
MNTYKNPAGGLLSLTSFVNQMPLPLPANKKEAPSSRRTPLLLQGVERLYDFGFAPPCVLALCFLL